MAACTSMPGWLVPVSPYKRPTGPAVSVALPLNIGERPPRAGAPWQRDHPAKDGERLASPALPIRRWRCRTLTLKPQMTSSRP